MAPKFGTSGLRGLVSELTRPLVEAHVTAFLSCCAHGGALHLGRDLRPSSPEIARWVSERARAMGLSVVDCGTLPTPALALSAQEAGAAAIMVTGSHIPADRNGLKFYTPAGEILKAEEARITASLGQSAAAPAAPRTGPLEHRDAGVAYVARLSRGFAPDTLRGLTVGVYQHSSVARDLMVAVVVALGGRPVPIARSERFIPVDTEALDPETRALFAGWYAEHGLDVLISTDGDADRPMLVDEAARVVPGDVLGALAARHLGAEVVVTPVSANSMLEDPALGFAAVRRTRIGSPFVIAAMAEAPAGARVVGFEPNGGFLLGFQAGALAPLRTRDSLLPMLAALAAARAAGQPLAALIDALPARFTAADRLTGVAPARGQALIAALSAEPAARAAFFDSAAPECHLDETDGLRVGFADGTVVHLRPSGNAPEFRCYAEAGSREAAAALVARHLERLRARLSAQR
jgi:phosphomannomutase